MDNSKFYISNFFNFNSSCFFLYLILFLQLMEQILYEFSLFNFKEFFVDEIYIRTFVRTIFLAIIVMTCCIILGLPCCVFLARYAGKYKYAILLMLIIPLFMSYIIKIYMMRSILGYSGLINKVLAMLGLIEKPLEFFMESKFSYHNTCYNFITSNNYSNFYLLLDKIPKNIIEASLI